MYSNALKILTVAFGKPTLSKQVVYKLFKLLTNAE